MKIWILGIFLTHCTFLDPDSQNPSNLKIENGMVLIPAKNATFVMGEVGWSIQLLKPHSVTLTENIWMDLTEVRAFEYFQKIDGTVPLNTSPNEPINLRTWYQAVLYCNARSKAEGLDTVYAYDGVVDSIQSGPMYCGRGVCKRLAGLKVDFSKNGFRLPTEAEWEYAARARTTTKYFWGNDSNDYSDYAWAGEPSTGDPHLVALKKPNGFGLYDMAGNVWEWVNDYYGSVDSTPVVDPVGPDSGQLKVVKGGGRTVSPGMMTPALRGTAQPIYIIAGFRCVRREP